MTAARKVVIDEPVYEPPDLLPRWATHVVEYGEHVKGRGYVRRQVACRSEARAVEVRDLMVCGFPNATVRLIDRTPEWESAMAWRDEADAKYEDRQFRWRVS